MTRTLTTLTVLLVATLAPAVATTASAQPRSVYIEDLTFYEIQDAMRAGRTTAIIFAGGTEQNGPHMVLAKHNVIARHVAGQMAERLGNALVYPVMPFSPAGNATEKTGHMRFPGTVSLSPEVFMGVMRQIGLSALSAGFENVVLLGDHGQGQNEIRLAAESLDAEWRGRDRRVFYVSLSNAAQRTNAYFKQNGITGGGHAAVAETAQMLFLDGSNALIRRDQLAVAGAGPEPTTGVGGNPSPATAEMGRLFIDYKIEDGVTQVRDLLAGRE